MERWNHYYPKNMTMHKMQCLQRRLMMVPLSMIYTTYKLTIKQFSAPRVGVQDFFVENILFACSQNSSFFFFHISFMPLRRSTRIRKIHICSRASHAYHNLFIQVLHTHSCYRITVYMKCREYPYFRFHRLLPRSDHRDRFHVPVVHITTTRY